MARKGIPIDVERKLCAESMGRCMNPACQAELFRRNGNVIEKAHITPYCKTADNNYENLVILCPTCHTDFDQNDAFSPEQVKKWKHIRKTEIEHFFSKKYSTFEELQKRVYPILSENKSIYENYYLSGQKELWESFEGRVLANNRKLKLLLERNLGLFQRRSNVEFSNLAIVQQLLTHIDEFEATRCQDEKIRHVLFPEQVNSIFGVSPMDGTLLPMTESLEILVERLDAEGKFVTAVLGIKNPYIQICENNRYPFVYLNDAPRIRQLYYNYQCFRKTGVRFESLNFALNYLRSRKIGYTFVHKYNFREVLINGTKMIFVYEYCLSEIILRQMLPDEGAVVVNLHNWNGNSCISQKAYEFAKNIGVTLLTIEDFYVYINGIK